MHVDTAIAFAILIILLRVAVKQNDKKNNDNNL